MARKKTKMAYITDDANRRRTFAKRKKGLLKKVSELSVLCGVPACALVAAPGEPNHDIWPSIVGADALISQLKSLPAPDQDKRSLDQEKYLAQTVSRLKEQLRKIEKENQEAEAKAELFRFLCGNDDDARGAGADAREVSALVEGKARAVKERINGCPPAVAEAALQPPAVEEEEEMKNMWGGVGDVYDSSSSSSNNGFYFTCNFNNYGSYNNLGSLIFPSGPSF
ncbi:Agamous-like MADS-box protein AGL80 [Acorus gramineus]|uniref:Agamous-like MADS-box protein AGL80 n=1 Tax=Acorus gramineus TaxID=55184 RepID=A0AAV9BB32_ACOGR|nr:Agamous-like MADS-box protein AGL80 [Acorus gramineus]